jgi:rhamnosyltransferase subunit B
MTHMQKQQSSLKVFISCLGTIGDLNPYISVGVEMARRGHDVTLLSDGSKRELVRKAGLKFAEVLPRGRYEDAMQRVYAAQESSLEIVFKYLCLPTILPSFHHIAAHYVPNNTLLIGVPGAIGLKFAHEKLGLPLVHLYLNPYQTQSGDLNDNVEQGKALQSLFNQLRGLVKLPPLIGRTDDWSFDADARIAAFPNWYGEAHGASKTLNYTSFIYSDEVGHEQDDGALQAFLAAGPPPIVFTAGTGARHVRSFFEAAIHACGLLHARGILLCTDSQQVPGTLPSHVCHSSYAALGPLLQKVEGIVHHGGVGTCAQALRAGVYQLVKPLAFDQHDNAQRLESLGVGRIVKQAELSGQRLAEEIRVLRESQTVKSACERFASLLRTDDARAAIADLLETAA